MKRNHYQILGVDPFSSRQHIKEAYKEAVFRFHPDRNKSPDASEEFLAIQQAYEILANPVKKIDYDSTLSNQNKVLPIKLELKYSQSPAKDLHEPQLLYALLDVHCDTLRDPATDSAIAVAMVVDTSTSMAGERLDSVKRSLLSLVKQLNPDDIFCVVAFNDQAQIILPLTRIRDFNANGNEISRMGTSGGTEMLHGLRLGLDLLDGVRAAHCHKQLVLYTDGKTYGDENECLLLARQAAMRKVTISGFGFGSEWNDVFLDKLTSITGGETKFIAASQDLDRYVKEKFSEFSQLFSQSVKFIFSHRQDVSLDSAFRLYQSPAPLNIEDIIMLGNVKFNGKLSVLLEFRLPSKIQESLKFRIGQGFVTIDSPYWESDIRKFITFDTVVSSQHVKSATPFEIENALAIITMYRIQEKARNDVANGKQAQAIIKLNHLINHLTELGHHELVMQVLIERDSIARNGSYSQSGDKTIKYGTRALLLPGN